MTKYKNLSNIDILKKYVTGERPFIQFGYVIPDKKRNIGEEWQDVKGITWRQENGFQTRINKQADIIRSATVNKCNSCGRDIRWGSRLDKVFFNKTGLCESCLIDYETKLRILGIYDIYEQYKMLSNELGFLNDAKRQIEDVIKFFSDGNPEISMVCNSEGFVEKWKDINREQILTDSKKDLKLARKKIIAITKAKNIAKKKYIAETVKYKLEKYV